METIACSLSQDEAKIRSPIKLWINYTDEKCNEISILTNETTVPHYSNTQKYHCVCVPNVLQRNLGNVSVTPTWHRTQSTHVASCNASDQMNDSYIKHLNYYFSTPLEIITPNGDAIIKEVTAVLREWLELWKKLFLVSKANKRWLHFFVYRITKARF